MAERAKFAQLENLRRRRPPSWISQNVNVSGLDEDICIKFGVKIYYGHEEMTHEREVETGSWFAWRHQMNVSKNGIDLKDYKSYLTKFGIESSSAGLSTWRNVPNSLNVKIQDGDGCHIEFRKMSLCSDWIKISVPNLVRICNAAMWDDYMTKCRNQLA